MSTIVAFTPVEVAVIEAIEGLYPDAAGKVGGSPSYDRGDGLYVWVSLLPGGGRTNETEGEWGLDIDVFSDDYLTAISHALNVEAALLGARSFNGSGMRLDRMSQNSAPAERPWDDSKVARVGGVYVFSARRV